MIDVARIDYWASSGSGVFHKASVPAKLCFVMMIVAAAVVSRSAAALGLGYAILLITASLAGLPAKRIAPLSFYAAIFAALYGLSLRGVAASVYLLVILKAITPALSVLMLISSTPYPRIYSLAAAILPEMLAAGLFMTYRSFFILLDLMNNFVVALRLRAGIGRGRIFRTVLAIPRGIAMLLVSAVERSSRLYAVMTVRGYSGSMAEKERWLFTWYDWLPLAAGAAILTLAIIL